jgi:glycosyltransferase involved in cell wall biosynthesis
MKTRVVHIIAKLELGGAQEYVLYLLEHMDPLRFETFLITGSEGILLPDAEKIRGLNLIIIPELKREIRPGKDLMALGKMVAILRRLRRENPRILINTNGSKAGILGRWAGWLAGIPERIHTFHGFGFNDYQNFFVRSLYVLIEWLTARITTRMIFVSRSNMEKARGYGILTGNQGVLIRYGINQERFRKVAIDRAEKRKELGFPSGSPLVGMIACLKPQKSPLDYVRTARLVKTEIPDCQFLLAGDGVLRPQMENLVRELGMEESFRVLGWRRDIPEIMKTLDLLVLTSLWEGLPLVFIEALAAGVPIVATRVDGAEEIVEEEVTGSLCAPRDIQALARKAIYWLQAENRDKKAESHQLWEYEIELMVKKHEEFYGGLFFSNQTECG